MEKHLQEPLLSPAIHPMASFAFARKDSDGKQFPQAIAHRGYKAKYPENTLEAFARAAEVGVHAIETDVHLSKDDVVVISHDSDLKRCYGKQDKIIDCEWKYLSTVRTLQEPHEPMPRLVDLLKFLKKPEYQHLWILLDIKIDNDADDMMRLIAHAIDQVEPAEDRPWNKRIVLGCWTLKYVPLCGRYLPDFPITHIGVSVSYARKFLAFPNCSFNMLLHMLIGPAGARFMQHLRKLRRPIIGWTVNDKSLMAWAIKKNLDGVISDNPKTFLELCDQWEEESKKAKIGVKVFLLALWIQLLVLLLAPLFHWRREIRDRHTYRRRIAA